MADTVASIHCVCDRVINEIAKRHKKRYARDHRLYTEDEFKEVYGKRGAELWCSAPHYENLDQLLKEWELCVLCYNMDNTVVKHGQFGILLPDFLLLVRVKHLNGKLKSCRLAPDGWSPSEIWNEALVISVGQSSDSQSKGSILVVDFRRELYRSGDMAMASYQTMYRYAQEFFEFLEDDRKEPNHDALLNNEIMQFLCVSSK